MIIVRPEQIEAFSLQAEACFVERVKDYVQAEYEDSVIQLSTGPLTIEQLPDATLRKMIKNGVTRARGYGLSLESSLSAFVTLMFVVAPNFDEQPLIHEILSDKQTQADFRIDDLWERTSEENWDEAQRMYDSNAWKVEEQER